MVDKSVTVRSTSFSVHGSRTTVHGHWGDINRIQDLHRDSQRESSSCGTSARRLSRLREESTEFWVILDFEWRES